MRVGEMWQYIEDGVKVKIIKIWQDDPEDEDKMVKVKTIDGTPDDFPDYFVSDFGLYFKRLYDNH